MKMWHLPVLCLVLLLAVTAARRLSEPAEHPHIRFVGVSANGTHRSLVFEMVNRSDAPFCFEGFATNAPEVSIRKWEAGRWWEYDLRSCFVLPMMTLEPRTALKFYTGLPSGEDGSRQAVGVRFFPGRAERWGRKPNRIQELWLALKFRLQGWIGYRPTVPPMIWSDAVDWE